MRLVEIDRIDLGRLRGEIGQRVAAAGRNGDDGRSERQLQRGEIGFRIFPDLGVDQTTEPECEKPVPNGRFVLRSCCCGPRPRSVAYSSMPRISNLTRVSRAHCSFATGARPRVELREQPCHILVARTSQGVKRSHGDMRWHGCRHILPKSAHEAPRGRSKPPRRMNRMYRRQRHIYDGTRRYYLLGRDQLIADLRPGAGANVLEIGCGTGRNLVLAARRYPDARFFGIDVSTEMLTSAISAISRARSDRPDSRRAWRWNGVRSAGLVRRSRGSTT